MVTKYYLKNTGEMGGDRQPGELLAGSYNPDQRRREVMGRLEASFDEIRKMDIRKMVEDEMAGGRKQGGRGRGRLMNGERGASQVEGQFNPSNIYYLILIK